MKRLKTIMVPTDLSENSRRALSYGCWVAAEERAAVVILHVTKLDIWDCYSEDLAYVQFDRQPWPIDRVLAEASLDLNRFLEPHLPDLTKTAAATRRVVLGAVPEQIAGVAEEENADLIIMSPRRRRALRHMIFGAITDKVMRLSPCPVLSITEPKPSKTWRGKLLPLYFGGPRPRAAGI